MAVANPVSAASRRPITALRWWIGGLLFVSTVINYVDRQVLSVLAPYLKRDYQWSNEDYALIVIAFRLGYSVGQTIWGRLIDRVGTRRGLTVSVIWYSVAAMSTALATGLRSFALLRFLLGAGESANWPAATKAVSEWFPKHERGLAVALFDSGSSIGAAIAPWLVVWLYVRLGGWRPAFVMIGTLGFLWLIGWRRLYYPPESHPRISEPEREMILKDKLESELKESARQLATENRCERWSHLLRLPQTWGVIVARSFTDPVWFFITDWFAIYLVAKGFKVEETLLAFWIPFIAADLGNFFGGGMSSWLIQGGWPVMRARKAVIVFGAIGMTMLIPTIFTDNLFMIAGLFSISTFAYAAFSTIAIVLPSDLYPSESVASVSGLSGTGAGLGTIMSTYVIGYVADRYSFEPILIAASLVPLSGAVLSLFLLRNKQVRENGF